jgi:hypothetical protein
VLVSDSETPVVWGEKPLFDKQAMVEKKSA